jgi:glyoxylase-like metal-dependent hydrolase (beta-lactamase superfamily II)
MAVAAGAPRRAALWPRQPQISLWVPSLKAVFDGVLIFSGVHVWTADTNGAYQQAARIKNLDLIVARKPSIVVPGHMPADAKTDLSGV